ncbi:MAG: hormogonium polysaccharide biosynthesis protein HpsL [Oculatellaceae cyanobacterium Prado106]|nr:hormogonium polysaccharide biosynthesis protein HpsL [Oculatellaceae cyanobacterium Prado106]
MVKTKPKSNKPKSKKGKSRSEPQPEGEVLSLKEQLKLKRKAERQRKELVQFTVSAIGFALFLGALVGIVAEPKLAVGAVLAVLCLTLSFKYPRQALWGFLIYLPLSGTVIYALGNSPVLQLAKDGFYIPALIGVVQYCRRAKLPILIPKQITLPLAILLSCCALTLLVVNGGQQFIQKVPGIPIAMGILGIKVLIGYAPLIVCAYYLLRNRQDFLFLMRLSTLLIILCCGLGLVQYLMLLTGICQGTDDAVGADLFKATIDARCFVGGSLLYSPSQGVIRLPGTFVAPWQWGWFLISSSFIGFPTAFNDPKPFWRLVGLVGLGAVFVMAVVSGQRIALALVPIAVGILLVFTGQVTNLKRFLPIGVALGMLLSFAALKNPETVQERLDSFISRWNAAPPYAFIQQQMEWAIAQGGWIGRGLGRATNSARVLGETQLVETYYPKLIYEIGILGALAFFILVTTLTYVTFKAYHQGRDRTLRAYGAALWVFILFISYNTYYYPLDVDPVAVYYWFFAGAILKLPEIDRAERKAAAELSKPTDQRKKSKKKAGFG